MSQRAVPEGVTTLRDAGRLGATQKVLSHCIFPVLSISKNHTLGLHIFLYSLVPGTGPAQDLAPWLQGAFNACCLLLGLLLMRVGSLGGQVLGGQPWSWERGAGGRLGGSCWIRA